MANEKKPGSKRKAAPQPSTAFGPAAERLRKAGELERAIALCEEGLSRFPDHLSGRVTLGWALLDLGRYDDARRELEQVLRKAPDNLAAIRGMAELHDRVDTTLLHLEADPSWPEVSLPDASASGSLDEGDGVDMTSGEFALPDIGDAFQAPLEEPASIDEPALSEEAADPVGAEQFEVAESVDSDDTESADSNEAESDDVDDAEPADEPGAPNEDDEPVLVSAAQAAMESAQNRNPTSVDLGDSDAVESVESDGLPDDVLVVIEADAEPEGSPPDSEAKTEELGAQTVRRPIAPAAQRRVADDPAPADVGVVELSATEFDPLLSVASAMDEAPDDATETVVAGAPLALEAEGEDSDLSLHHVAMELRTSTARPVVQAADAASDLVLELDGSQLADLDAAAAALDAELAGLDAIDPRVPEPVVGDPVGSAPDAIELVGAEAVLPERLTPEPMVEFAVGSAKSEPSAIEPASVEVSRGEDIPGDSNEESSQTLDDVPFADHTGADEAFAAYQARPSTSEAGNGRLDSAPGPPYVMPESASGWGFPTVRPNVVSSFQNASPNRGRTRRLERFLRQVQARRGQVNRQSAV